MNSRFFKAAFLTGLFAGTLDILYAFITVFIRTGNFAEKMFHYLAGGALGVQRSMQGGTWVALLGMFFHYFIALSFTFFFFWIFPRLKFLSYNKYLVGMLYGVFVNVAMRAITYFFTPLPAPAPFTLERAFVDWVIFGIVFGIPIAFNAYKYYGVKNEPLVK